MKECVCKEHVCCHICARETRQSVRTPVHALYMHTCRVNMYPFFVRSGIDLFFRGSNMRKKLRKQKRSPVRGESHR